MASTYESRIHQAICEYESRRYTSIRTAAAANEVDHKTLGRRIQGGLSRTLAAESKQLLTNKQELLLGRWILELRP